MSVDWEDMVLITGELQVKKSNKWGGTWMEIAQGSQRAGGKTADRGRKPGGGTNQLDQKLLKDKKDEDGMPPTCSC